MNSHSYPCVCKRICQQEMFEQQCARRANTRDDSDQLITTISREEEQVSRDGIVDEVQLTFSSTRTHLLATMFLSRARVCVFHHCRSTLIEILELDKDEENRFVNICDERMHL